MASQAGPDQMSSDWLPNDYNNLQQRDIKDLQRPLGRSKKFTSGGHHGLRADNISIDQMLTPIDPFATMGSRTSECSLGSKTPEDFMLGELLMANSQSRSSQAADTLDSMDNLDDFMERMRMIHQRCSPDLLQSSDQLVDFNSLDGSKDQQASAPGSIRAEDIDFTQKLKMFHERAPSTGHDQMVEMDGNSASIDGESTGDLISATISKMQQLKLVKELTERPSIDVPERQKLEDVQLLKDELAVIRQEKLDLMSQNEMLLKAKDELECALEEAKRSGDPDLEGTNANKENDNSIDGANSMGSALEWDPDVQRLFSLSQLLGDENAKLRDKINEMQLDFAGLRNEIAKANTITQDLEKENGSLKAERDGLDAEIQKLSAALVQNADHHVSAADQDDRAASDKYMELQGNYDNAQKTIDELRALDGLLQEENSRLKRNLSEKADQLVRVEDQMSSLERNAKIAGDEFLSKESKLNEENIRLRGELSEKMEKLVRIEEENGEKQSRLDMLTRQNESLLSRVDRFEEMEWKKKAMEATIAELRDEVAKERSVAQKACADLDKERACVASLMEEMQALRSNEKQLSEDLKAANSCLSTLKLGSSCNVSTLENQISAAVWSADKIKPDDHHHHLQQNSQESAGVEEQLHKLISRFSESLMSMQQELVCWKNKSEGLQAAFESAQMNNRIKSEDLIAESVNNSEKYEENNNPRESAEALMQDEGHAENGNHGEGMMKSDGIMKQGRIINKRFCIPSSAIHHAAAASSGAVAALGLLAVYKTLHRT